MARPDHVVVRFSITMKMDFRTQCRMFVRSLFIQGAWDYERAQGLGFAWCLDPWLKGLYPRGGQELKNARQRHMEYFNTQPYMAGIVLGAAARMEESAARHPTPALENRIVQVKKSMEAALAGIGDPLFWGAWRPLCAALAMALVFALPTAHQRPVVFGVVVYLILYNILAQWFRWSGIRWGYEFGEQVAERLKRLDLQRSLRRIRYSGLILAAFAVIATVAVPILRGGAGALWPVFVRGSLLLMCLAMKRMRWTALRAYGALTALAIGAALALP